MTVHCICIVKIPSLLHYGICIALMDGVKYFTWRLWTLICTHVFCCWLLDKGEKNLDSKSFGRGLADTYSIDNPSNDINVSLASEPCTLVGRFHLVSPGVAGVSLSWAWWFCANAEWQISPWAGQRTVRQFCVRGGWRAALRGDYGVIPWGGLWIEIWGLGRLLTHGQCDRLVILFCPCRHLRIRVLRPCDTGVVTCRSRMGSKIRMLCLLTRNQDYRGIFEAQSL
jgi:hypothetical protein